MNAPPAASAAPAPEVGVAVVGQLTLAIGAQAPPFEGLVGTDGQRYGFSSFADRQALVLLFTSNRCPTAKAYTERLMALQTAVGPRGAQIVLLNANDPHLYPEERVERIIERVAAEGLTVPYLVDEGQVVARGYGPTCTFHAFVLDERRRLRYQGRFDDARIAASVTRHDLAEALDDVLDGREVRVPVTRAFGCALDYV